MFDVFVSYPRADRPVVEPIKAKLEAAGFKVFFDVQDIDGGANFPDAIDQALRRSKSVLCCWNANYFTRPWCMIECRDALARGTIVPVALKRFDQFAPPADLRTLNWFDLTDWKLQDAHEGWRRAMNAIEVLVGKKERARPAAVEPGRSWPLDETARRERIKRGTVPEKLLRLVPLGTVEATRPV